MSLNHQMDTNGRCQACRTTQHEINTACYQTARLHALLDSAGVPMVRTAGVEMNVYGRVKWLVDMVGDVRDIANVSVGDLIRHVRQAKEQGG